MRNCLIAVGTENSPKLNACRTVLEHLAGKLFDGQEYHILSRQTASGVSDMPLSMTEMMQGAKFRAHNVYNTIAGENRPPDFAIGMEGGFFAEKINLSDAPLTFLQSWVYVFDGHRGSWGSSGAVPVPWKVAQPVIENNEELAVVIDRVAEQNDIRSGIGAVGIFTDGEILREDFFRQALMFAFAPFYNRNFYVT